MKDNEKKAMELARGTAEFNPFGMMRRFTKDMEHLFEDFGGFRFPSLFIKNLYPFGTEFTEFDWMPQIEVMKTDSHWMVRADLPGLTKDQVKVELTDEALMISGERKEEKEEKAKDFYRTERNYGRFFRTIPLPDGAEMDKATATFNNGVLEVKVPAKKVELTTRKLEIKEGPEKLAKAATA